MSIGKKRRGGLAQRNATGLRGRVRTSDRIRSVQGTSINHYTENWAAIRESILIRDNHTCTRCGACCFPGEYSNVVLTVDHIVPISRGGKTVAYNLTTLCSDCHSNKLGKANKRGGKLLKGSAERIRKIRNDKRSKS